MAQFLALQNHNETSETPQNGISKSHDMFFSHFKCKITHLVLLHILEIESGSLHLSQLTRVQKCLKESAEKGKLVSSSTTLKVLQKIENKNSFETDKLLAQTFDLPVQVREILKPQKDDSVRLEITLTAEQFKELEQC